MTNTLDAQSLVILPNTLGTFLRCNCNPVGSAPDWILCWA